MKRFSASVHKIVLIEGCWCILHRNKGIGLVKLAGSPVRSFISGWYPKFFVDIGLNVYLLEMAHNNGQGATWLLDEDYNHITDQITALPVAIREVLLDQVREIAKSVYDGLLSNPRLDNGEKVFLSKIINENTIRQFINVIAQDGYFSCNVFESHSFGAQTISLESGRINIDLNHLDTIFQLGLQESVDAALRNGYLSCPSPVNGVELKSYDSIVIHEHRMAFRFVDPSYNFVFYLSATHHPTKIADLYIPAANVAFTPLPDDSRTPNSGLVAEYLTHFVARHEEISSYLRTSQHTPAVVCRGFPGLHIGHQLWNELTAYERLATSLDSDRLPVLVVPNAEYGSEAYGPMDMLFPEWKGKVDRSLLMSFETLGEFVYRKNYFLFRAIDHFVTVRLSERLVQFACTTPETSISRTRAADLTAKGFTLITLGLRVENRTAVNLYEMCEQIITHLAQKISKLAVVIDGHNSRLNGDVTTAYESFGQRELSSPVLVEIELATKLRRHFEFTEVQIINAIGCSVVDSIVWTQASLCFIAIWGASLAKYRWVYNKIGLVISQGHSVLP